MGDVVEDAEEVEEDAALARPRVITIVGCRSTMTSRAATAPRGGLAPSTVRGRTH